MVRLRAVQVGVGVRVAFTVGVRVGVFVGVAVTVGAQVDVAVAVTVGVGGGGVIPRVGVRVGV